MQLTDIAGQRGSAESIQFHDFAVRNHRRSLSDPLPENAARAFSVAKEIKSGTGAVSDQFRDRMSIKAGAQTDAENRTSGVFDKGIPPM